MKKISLFFVILGIFVFSFSTVQASEKKFIQEISINNSGFSISQTLERIKNFFTLDAFASTYSEVNEGGSGTCGRYYSWHTCTIPYSLISERSCKLKQGYDVSSFELEDNLWRPKGYSWICDVTKWKINQATLTTVDWPERGNDVNQCLMRVNIVKSANERDSQASSEQLYCAIADSSNDNGNRPNSVSVDFKNSDNSPSGAAEVIVDIHGKAGDGVGPWKGKLELVGTRPNMNIFNLTGIDYATRQSQTVGSGQTLEICKGSSVMVEWSASDSSGTYVLVGSPVQNLFGNSGAQTFTPVVDTNVVGLVAGFAGESYSEMFYNEGINITLHDCSGGPSPWVQINANPDTINSGESSTLTWTSGNTDSCQAVGNTSDWTGDKTKNGNVAVTPSSTRWYEIKCTDGTTEVSDSAKVKVNGAITPVGSLNAKIRLNGVEITTPIDVSFDLNGPETVAVDSAPQSVELTSGTYNLRYISSGPENSTFLGFSPGSSILVSSNQTSTVYLDFTDGAGRCNITVQATKYSCDATSFSPWTGALSYGLIGPIILNGTNVDQTFENVPAGRYYLTSLVGGPGDYNGVTPGNPVSCPSGGNVNVMMKFKDCDTSYKCNYSTGRCDLCDASSSECKYDNLSTCNMQCAGCATNHDPKANIFCWANFDSEECVGVNDNNDTTPSIILYDKSTDPCGDIEDCLWEIFDSTGKLIKTANTCAPYPWYDETPATYKAKITVTDSQGKSSTDTQPFTIKNVDALTCNFAWDPDAPTVNGTTNFFDQTLTPNGTTLTSWKWTFENATPASSTAQTVSNVIFNSAGTKNITLTVKNSANKTCTITKSITVKTINPYWKEVIPF
jgi:hypothetical protein